MPKIHVEKSILIDAPAEQVYGYVRDFRQWNTWSPWLIAEPECKVVVDDDGRSYAWEGKIVGQGSMEVLAEDPERSIDYRLTFLKPRTSVASVRFQFDGADGKQNVTWTMDSSLPFFLFWMKSMITGFVGMDYARGLMMLKEVIEKGEVSSKLEFPGSARFDGCTYVGVRSRCEISEIGTQMRSDMERLTAWLEETSTKPSGFPFAIYHKWEAAKGTAEYTVCAPVENKPENLPNDLRAGEVPSCMTYRVRHLGPYHHLGNAWSSGIAHAQAKLFRQAKSIHPFEVYENDPREVAEEDLATTVHFPVKE